MNAKRLLLALWVSHSILTSTATANGESPAQQFVNKTWIRATVKRNHVDPMNGVGWMDLTYLTFDTKNREAWVITHRSFDDGTSLNLIWRGIYIVPHEEQHGFVIGIAVHTRMTGLPKRKDATVARWGMRELDKLQVVKLAVRARDGKLPHFPKVKAVEAFLADKRTEKREDVTRDDGSFFMVKSEESNLQPAFRVEDELLDQLPLGFDRKLIKKFQPDSK